MGVSLRYAPPMEPMSNIDLVQSIALALWPVWAVLAALLVVKLASRFGYMAPDEYEEVPCGCSFGNCCGFCSCCQPERLERERRYHDDNGWGR